MTCEVTIGNNGNALFSSGSVELRLDQHTPLTGATVTGIGSTCTPQTSTYPHKFLCAGGNLTAVPAGTVITGSLTLTVDENYDLLPNDATGTRATPLLVSSHVKTPSAEVNDTDNHAYDTIIPVLRDMSSIAGRVYIDVDGSKTRSIMDRPITQTQVCARGTNAKRETVYECQNTDENGDYVISGLLPGDYVLESRITETHTGSYSAAGMVERTVSGQQELVRHGKGSLQDESVAITQIAAVDLARGEHTREHDFAAQFTACPQPISWDVTTTLRDTTNASETIGGTVTSPNVTLTIQDKRVSIVDDQFAVRAPLDDGDNAFVLQVSNRYPSCTQERTIHITKRTTNPPKVTGPSKTVIPSKPTTPRHPAAPEKQSAPSKPGIGCRYSDEPYQDNGHFTDTMGPS